jgi:hypothetical protein
MQGVYRWRQQSGQKGCCGAMGETMFRMTKGMGTWTEGAQELLARANQRPHAVPRDINEPADSVRRHPGTREMTEPLVLRWPVPLSRAASAPSCVTSASGLCRESPQTTIILTCTTSTMSCIRCSHLLNAQGPRSCRERAAVRWYDLKCGITAIGRQDTALPNFTLQHSHIR